MKISVVSGGFDPIHSGHISYINAAKNYGDYLIIALNSDEWLVAKKRKAFMPFEERKAILENLKHVDEVIDFTDDDNWSAINALEKIKDKYPKAQITFCNGGDRGKDNIPEMQVEGYEFEFAVGGDNKANSSSWILKEWQYPTERRVWGEFSDLFQDDVVRVKELIIEPGKGISYQRHFYRGEIWHLVSGQAMIKTSKGSPSNYTYDYLTSGQHFSVVPYEWHQIKNIGREPLRIIEIQHGSYVDEDDIEREEIIH